LQKQDNSYVILKDIRSKKCREKKREYMAKKKMISKKVKDTQPEEQKTQPVLHVGKPSTVVDTRVVYCGDNLEQLKKLPDGCVDLIYIDPPFNSNRNYEVFWGETKEITGV
jgi:16S rRNA G966 N2-methylase RsmD